VSEDRQLRAVHLILNFEPIFDSFQDVGHAIKAGDPRLARIDVLVPGFLARDDIVPVELPSHHASRETVAPREETASSSLKAKIDRFYLEEEREEQGDSIIKVSDSKGEPDRLSGVHTSGLVVACIDDSSKDEEEKMALNMKKGLKELLNDKAKGSGQKDASGSQPLPTLPPHLTCFLCQT